MQAHEVDKTCGAEPNIKKVEERLEFTKINFQRAVLMSLLRMI